MNIVHSFGRHQPPAPARASAGAHGLVAGMGWFYVKRTLINHYTMRQSGSRLDRTVFDAMAGPMSGILVAAFLMSSLLVRTMSTPGYNLVVKRPIDLVTQLIEQLCGNAQISLEGDLTCVDMRPIPSSSTEPTSLLPRTTNQPIQGFIILPVEADTKEPLIRSILPRIGLRTRIYHIQMQKNGERVFTAYDQFHADTVWIGAWVDETWLTILVHSGILSRYTRIAGAF